MSTPTQSEVSEKVDYTKLEGGLSKKRQHGLFQLFDLGCVPAEERVWFGDIPGGEKKDATEMGFMCLEKREFCSTSIILITL